MNKTRLYQDYLEKMIVSILDNNRNTKYDIQAKVIETDRVLRHGHVSKRQNKQLLTKKNVFMLFILKKADAEEKMKKISKTTSDNDCFFTILIIQVCSTSSREIAGDTVYTTECQPVTVRFVFS